MVSIGHQNIGYVGEITNYQGEQTVICYHSNQNLSRDFLNCQHAETKDLQFPMSMKRATSK